MIRPRFRTVLALLLTIALASAGSARTHQEGPPISTQAEVGTGTEPPATEGDTSGELREGAGEGGAVRNVLERFETLELVGLSLAVLLCLQQTWILRKKDRVWARTVQFYRRQMAWSIRVVLVATLVVLVLLLFDRWSGGTRLLAPFAYLQRGGGPLIILLIAFFTGCIRLMWDRAVDDENRPVHFLADVLGAFFRDPQAPVKDRVLTLGRIPGSTSRNSWHLWFLFATATAAISAYITQEEAQGAGTDSSLTPTQLLLIAMGVTLVTACGAFCWVYVGLFMKLTEAHFFSGRAARLFLGQRTALAVPRQAVVIGPKSSGKSSLVSARQEPASAGGTPTILTRFFASEYIDASRAVKIAGVTVIDTPGENLGDHLMVASRFRADCLVLMVNGERIEPTLLRRELLSVKHFHQVFKSDKQHQDALYFRAFDFATTRSEQTLKATDLFHTRSFLLYVNVWTPKGREQVVPRLEETGRMRELAVEIGRRFGVEDDQECCAVAGNACLAAEGRGLLALDGVKTLAESLAHHGAGNLHVFGASSASKVQDPSEFAPMMLDPHPPALEARAGAVPKKGGGS
jgi:hypothetical protein